jgi:hypothetical protein
MFHNPNTSIAVVGIDIGKNSFRRVLSAFATYYNQARALGITERCTLV